MTACCSRRRDDGVVDGQAIQNAVEGRQTKITPREARIAIWRLSSERRWGPQQIADHLGYSKSQVSATLADIRAKP